MSTSTPGILHSLIPKNSDGDFSIARNSSKIILDANHKRKIVDNNVGGIDYTNSRKPMLLLETSATNLITYSEDFTSSDYSASWVDIQRIDNEYHRLTLARESTKDIPTASFTEPFALIRVNGLVEDQAYTYSVKVRRTDYSTGVLVWLLGDSDTNIRMRVLYDFETGSFSTQRDNIKSKAKWLNEDEVLISFTFNDYDDDNMRVGVAVYPQEIGNYIDVSCYQFEDNYTATSYIPTHGSPATRIDDVVEKFNLYELAGEEATIICSVGHVEQSVNTGTRKLLLYDDNTFDGIGTAVLNDGRLRISTTANTTAVMSPHQMSNSTFAIRYNRDGYSVFHCGEKLREASEPLPRISSLRIRLDYRIPIFNLSRLLLYSGYIPDSELMAMTS